MITTVPVIFTSDQQVAIIHGAQKLTKYSPFFFCLGSNMCSKVKEFGIQIKFVVVQVV